MNDRILFHFQNGLSQNGIAMLTLGVSLLLSLCFNYYEPKSRVVARFVPSACPSFRPPVCPACLYPRAS